MAGPITNFNLIASQVQAGLNAGKPLPAPPSGGSPPPVSDSFVPGGYPGVPAWQPMPGFTPINFPVPNWQPPAVGAQPVAEGTGDYAAFQPPSTPAFGTDFYKPSKLGYTYGDVTQAGSLVVVDQFNAPMPSFGIGGFAGPIRMAHGHLVQESAKGEGFQGNVVPSEHTAKYRQQQWDIDKSLNEPNLPREEFLKRLELAVSVDGIGLVDAMTERLEGLKEAGMHHSAVNLSYGMSQAAVLQERYSDAATVWRGWSPLPGFNQPLLDNYARAFDLDSAKLSSQDPAIHGPERHKFQQALSDQIGSIMDNNETLKESKSLFAAAVRDLEANHNSVVVSASNAGQVLERLAKDAGSSKPITVGKNFHDNVLATPETTVVGATEGSGASERVARYSSNYEEVDIYANGVAPLPSSSDQPENAQGTSFAAPKVAQAMAELHKLYPEKTSAEIEDMLKEQLSHQLFSYDGNVDRPVLNDHADFGMLSRYT
ncbi:MAG: S8/S53 family peptidase [Candidatus Eremiobacteraeota bacterium]|nr:S8/S53 family peptidase [Candidatus Eremiobacteraeota bacterium]